MQMRKPKAILPLLTVLVAVAATSVALISAKPEQLSPSSSTNTFVVPPRIRGHPNSVTFREVKTWLPWFNPFDQHNRLCWNAILRGKGCSIDVIRSMTILQQVRVSPLCCEAVSMLNKDCQPGVLFGVHWHLFPLVERYCEAIKNTGQQPPPGTRVSPTPPVPPQGLGAPTPPILVLPNPPPPPSQILPNPPPPPSQILPNPPPPPSQILPNPPPPPSQILPIPPPPPSQILPNPPPPPSQILPIPPPPPSQILPNPPPPPSQILPIPPPSQILPIPPPPPSQILPDPSPPPSQILPNPPPQPSQVLVPLPPPSSPQTLQPPPLAVAPGQSFLLSPPSQSPIVEFPSPQLPIVEVPSPQSPLPFAQAPASASAPPEGIKTPSPSPSLQGTYKLSYPD